MFRRKESDEANALAPIKVPGPTPWWVNLLDTTIVTFNLIFGVVDLQNRDWGGAALSLSVGIGYFVFTLFMRRQRRQRRVEIMRLKDRHDDLRMTVLNEYYRYAADHGEEQAWEVFSHHWGEAGLRNLGLEKPVRHV